MTTKLTLGLRNKNPGNIRHNPANKWQGLDWEKSGEFCCFESYAYGIRAMAMLIIKYQDSYGLNTIKGIINRWAPPSENDTDSFIKFVRDEMGFDPGQTINAHDFHDLKSLIKAITIRESSWDVIKVIPDSDYDLGLRMAGVTPPNKPISKSREIQAGAGAIGFLGLSQYINEIERWVYSIRGFNLNLPAWVFPVGIGILVAFMMWRRWQKKKRGYE